MSEEALSNVKSQDLVKTRCPDKLNVQMPHDPLNLPRTSIQSLANETLSQIFYLATHDSHDRHDAVLYPIIVSHVSSVWRQVALSTSLLWTSIILTHPSPWSQLSRTLAYISRSRRRPLDIFLDFRDPSWNWHESSHSFGWKHMENVIRLLSPHVLRWRNLELLTDTWSPIFTFLWYVRNVESAPMLESISLSRCNMYFAFKGQTFRPVALKQPIPLFGGTAALTALRTLRLAGVHIDWTSASLHDLIELELKYHAHDVMPSLSQFLDILARCPDLERLSILGWGPRFTIESGDTVDEGQPPGVGKLQRTICLSRLHHLVLGFLDVEYTIQLLSLFYLPDMKVFTLEDISATLHLTDHQDATPILEFLTTTHISACSPVLFSSSSCSSLRIPLCNIRTLELRAIYTNVSALSRFLHDFTALRRLSITNMDDTVFSALNHHEASPSPSLTQTAIRYPCPVLTDLICKQVDPLALLDLITAREGDECGQRVSHVLLDVRDEEDSLDAEHRDALVGAGVILLVNDAVPRRSRILPPEHQTLETR